MTIYSELKTDSFYSLEPKQEIIPVPLTYPSVISALAYYGFRDIRNDPPNPCFEKVLKECVLKGQDVVEEIGSTEELATKFREDCGYNEFIGKRKYNDRDLVHMMLGKKGPCYYSFCKECGDENENCGWHCRNLSNV